MQKEERLQKSLDNVGVALSSEQIVRLLDYFDLVKNAGFNLTAITEEEDFIVKHYEDSLAGVSEIPAGAKVLDIGCGGGFPCVPLAIAREDLTVVGIDSTAKKTTFVSESAKAIGINNLTTIAGRAEEMRDLFGKFDAVTARAVASLRILLELAAPMLKVGGVFLAYKADESELAESKNALKTLNMQFIHSKTLTLSNGEHRAILVFKKAGETPDKFPRQYGTIKKKPL